MFRKVFIANRGEIALRILRTCKKLGVKTVVAYSDPDIESRPVLEADEAYNIGPGEPSASYLNIANIVKAAKMSGADGIHPGYGFLAENPNFAEACEDARIVFIGPNSRILKEVANKLESKRIIADKSIPVIPGPLKPVASHDDADAEARRIGYPILVKAVFGGGGRGLRIIRSRNQLRNSLERAEAEAKAAFGHGDLYLEKYLEKPRHIEVQVLAGPRGRIVHLGERECSLQRRYQKILEETPSPVLSSATRERLVSLALKVARLTHYQNAGTMEFARSQDGKFYFIETNKRIQVEHLVTEQVTGIDIVEEQLRIASGEGLNLSQNEVDFNGAAVNCRINAEDPSNGFAPTPGRVTKFVPATGPRVRVDSALYDGCPVPEFYDSLVAKVSCHGRNREEAMRTMSVALDETIIDGVKTTIPVHQALMESPAFKKGAYHTQLLDSLLAEWKARETISPADAASIYVAIKATSTKPTTIAPLQATAATKWRQSLPNTATRPALYVEGL